MKKLIDRSGLLLTAAVASFSAWAFWHYSGDNAFSIMSTLLIILLLVDNVRLRNRLKDNNPRSK